ncbi:MAG TPA: TolC family protein [Pyrinomonadaceae bacterium]|nr:TolC family protein [Pyrinomonadaceae bacterium]
MNRESQQSRSFSIGLRFLLITALLQPFSGFGQQSETAQSAQLTLPQAVEIALRKNPLTEAAAAGRALADAQLQEARSGRVPLLQASETFTNSDNPVFVFGSLLEQGRFAPQNFAINSLNHPDPLNNFRSALTLRVPLFDQRQTETHITQARIRRQQADQKTDLVEQQLRFEVVRTYYAVLLSQARLGVADEATKTAEADEKRARDLFETGLTVQSDLLAAQVQLSEFRQQRIQAKAEIVVALAALNAALGSPINTPEQLSGELLDRNFEVESVELLLSEALQNRPDYQQAIASIEANAAQVRGARGEWLPRVEAVASAGASTRYLVTGGSGDYAVGASVTFNVFDASRKARSDQARATEAMARAQADQLANQIRFEVVRAYQQYSSARERLAVVAQVSAQASETLRIVQDRYHAGLTTITELLRAETALVRARSDVLSARYDQYIGYASVLLSAGRLKDVSRFTS